MTTKRYEIHWVDSGRIVRTDRYDDREEAKAAEAAGRYSNPQAMAFTVFVRADGESEVSGLR
jgi:hypothetical protein